MSNNIFVLFFILLIVYLLLNKQQYINKLKESYLSYYPNQGTGLFTKLIGIASVVGLCIISNKNFKSK